MFKFFKTKLSIYKKSIFTVNNKNLTKGSKVSLLIFVIIMFGIIGSGIDIQVQYTKNPYKEFGYQCLNIINKFENINKFKNRNVNNDIYNDYQHYNEKWELNDFVYNHYTNNKKTIYENFGSNKNCQEIGAMYLKVANNLELKDKLLKQKIYNRKLNDLKNNIRIKESEYGNALLENIAKQDKNKSILTSSADTVKEEIKNLNFQIGKINNKLKEVEDITNLQNFKNFKKIVLKKYNIINKEYAKALKYYKVKYTLNIFLFLFPLWFVFYILYRILKRKGHYISSHLSINVANVASLYIVFYLVYLIYDIIPKVFLEKLVKFLSQYNFTVLINVVSILIFMLIFGLFINKIQKNKTKDDKTEEKAIKENLKNDRIKKCLCPECGSLFKEAQTHCTFCNFDLIKKCSYCKVNNYVGNCFCIKCRKEFS
jgi:hypothetical protein